MAKRGRGSSIISVETELVRLHHGTDTESAFWIAEKGLNQEKAIAISGGDGEFWATTTRDKAELFSGLNPSGGVPAIVSFDLPTATLEWCMSQAEPLAVEIDSDVYRLYPGSFHKINCSMTNVVTVTTEE